MTVEYFTEAELEAMTPLERHLMEQATALANATLAAQDPPTIEGMGGQPYDVVIDPATGEPIEYPEWP